MTAAHQRICARRGLVPRLGVRALLSCFLLPAVLWPARLEGQAPSANVSLQIDGCVGIDETRFSRLLFLELGTSASQQAETTAGSTAVAVVCSSTEIEVTVADAVTRKHMRRTLRRHGRSTEAPERLLALAVAEFIVAGWVELSLQKHPAALEPTAPAPSERAITAARNASAPALPAPSATRPDPTQKPVARPQRGYVTLGPHLSWLNVVVSNGPSLLGGGFSLDVHVLDGFSIGLRGSGLFGQVSTTEGHLRLNLVGGNLGARYDLRIGETTQVGLGAGMYLGRLQVTSTPFNSAHRSGSERSEAFGGPFIGLRVKVPMDTAIWLAVHGSVGLVTLPAEVHLTDDSTALDASGAWLSLSAELLVGL